MATMTLTILSTTSPYPLTTPQKSLVNEQLQTFTTELTTALENLRKACTETHSLTPTTCVPHSTELRRLLKQAYTNPLPGSWASYRPASYISDLTRLFDAGASIESIHSRIAREQRLHLRDALCTTRVDDNEQVKSYKATAATMFDDPSVPAQEVLDFVKRSEEEMRSSRTAHEQELQDRWDKCYTPEERYAFYRSIATSHVEGESKADATLREKWLALFAEERPYGEIYSIMKKDVEKSRETERMLRSRLQELDLARTALGRAQVGRTARAREKEQERLRMWGPMNGRPRCVRCGKLVVPKDPAGSLPPCCGVCEDEVEDGRRERGSGWFCSEECVHLGAREHILNEHEDLIRQDVEMLERLEGEGENGRVEKHPDSA